MRFDKFINDALPRPDGTNLTPEAKKQFWDSRPARGRPTKPSAQQEGTVKAADRVDEEQWRKDLIQANVESVYCVYSSGLGGYYNAVKSEFTNNQLWESPGKAAGLEDTAGGQGLARGSSRLYLPPRRVRIREQSDRGNPGPAGDQGCEGVVAGWRADRSVESRRQCGTRHGGNRSESLRRTAAATATTEGSGTPISRRTRWKTRSGIKSATSCSTIHAGSESRSRHNSKSSAAASWMRSPAAVRRAPCRARLHPG